MNTQFTPDGFMQLLYNEVYKSPYDNVKTAQAADAAAAKLKSDAAKIFNLDCIPFKTENLQLIPIENAVKLNGCTAQKHCVEICTGLNMLVWILKPEKLTTPAPAVVALCGHGYGVRQIVGVSKNGKAKKLRYIDNYQKTFALKLAQRGCIVAAPELVGFGEARLEKDLIKPFYLSSCDELSHHLLPHGLTLASLRIYQAMCCADILYNMEETDKEKLGCMGISGGGLTALYASVLDERINRIAISGYVNSFKSSILSLWHCPDNYFPDVLSSGEIFDFACALAPRTLVVESGVKDKLFPIDASRKAHTQLRYIYALYSAENNLTIDEFNGKHMVNGEKAFAILSE